MTVGEYVLVLVSLVLGLGITDVLASFHRLLRAGARVRWAVLPVAAAVLIVLLSLMMWWSQFPEDQTRPVTIGQFLPRFAVFVALFLTAAAALPDEVPPEGLDLGAWYRANARHFWSLATLVVALTMVLEGADAVARDGLRALPGFLSNRSFDVVVLLLFGSLAVLKARWWHAAVLALAYVGPVFWVSRSIG